MYLYKSHLDDLYWSEYEISFDELFCEICGDYDYMIEYFESTEEVLKSLADNICINSNDCGNFDIEYILEVVDIFDDCLVLDDAIKIVMENKTYKEEQ